jgi:hypothetical protein
MKSGRERMPASRPLHEEAHSSHLQDAVDCDGLRTHVPDPGFKEQFMRLAALAAIAGIALAGLPASASR